MFLQKLDAFFRKTGLAQGLQAGFLRSSHVNTVRRLSAVKQRLGALVCFRSGDNARDALKVFDRALEAVNPFKGNVLGRKIPVGRNLHVKR